MTAKVTKESVEQARKQLVDQGEKVTPTAIQRLTGGSKSTVYKVLNELEEDDLKTSLYREGRNNEDLITDVTRNAINMLYSQCWHKAESLALATCRAMQSYEEDARNMFKQLDEIEQKYQAKEGQLNAEKDTLKQEVEKLQAIVRLCRERLKSLGGEEALKGVPEV